MNRRSFFISLSAVVASVVAASSALAAPKSYKYRCPKCKLIQEYGQRGAKKCPNDGSSMVPVN